MAWVAKAGPTRLLTSSHGGSLDGLMAQVRAMEWLRRPRLVAQGPDAESVHRQYLSQFHSAGKLPPAAATVYRPCGASQPTALDCPPTGKLNASSGSTTDGRVSLQWLFADGVTAKKSCRVSVEPAGPRPAGSSDGEEGCFSWSAGRSRMRR